jgi:excisionase family DNA binding protein
VNAAVNTLYAEYLEHTGGDKAAAASLALADLMQRTLDAGTPPPTGQSLTVKEAAVSLHVSPSCIYELCESGKLSSFKVGRVLRIHPEAIDDYRRQGTISCRQEPFSGRHNRCL